MLRLVIEDGEGTTHVVPLIRDEITVGREEGNTIRLTERNVSRRHARLVRNGADETMTVLVQDLDSYNGVRVNGNRIVGQCSLAADDTIQIGDYLLALEAKPQELEERPDITRVTALHEHADTTAPLQEENRGRLVVVSSNLAGQEYHLTEREMVLGRTDDLSVQLVVNHRSISANHAKFVCRDGRFTVIDMASANGLIVNGQAMTTTNLVNGDILEMGHVKFRFSGAGDDYTFSPSDIDDVVLPPTDKWARIAVLLFFFIGIALTGYVITDGLQDTDVDAIDPDEASVAQSQPAPISVQTQPVELQPESRSQGTELSRTMQEGRAAKNRQNWSDARAAFDRVLDIDPTHREAQKEAEAMADEMQYAAKFKRFKDLSRRKKYRKALDLASGFDKASYYYPQVEKEADNVRRQLRTQVTLRINRDLDRGAFRKARQLVDDLNSQNFSSSEITAFKDEIRAAERAAKLLAAESSSPRARASDRESRRTSNEENSASRVNRIGSTRRAKTAPAPVAKRNRAGGQTCTSDIAALQLKKMGNEIALGAYLRKLGKLGARCRKHKKTQKIACDNFMRQPGDAYKTHCDRYLNLLSSTSQKNAYKLKIKKERRKRNAQ